MHVRIRVFGKQDTIVVVESKLTKIDQFRQILHEKFDVEPKSQSLFYGGKLLEDGYTFHDYNIKLNDVIQLMVRVQPPEKTGDETEDMEIEAEVVPENIVEYTDAESTLYEVGDLVDIRDTDTGSWLEAKITRIVYDPSIPHLLDSTDSSMNDSSDLSHCDLSNQSIGKENELGNKTPNGTKNGDSFFKSNGKGIAKNSNKYFKSLRKKYKKNTTETKDFDSLLLYEVKTDGDDSEMYCKLKDIRPRARTIIDMKDLKVGQKVMLNYNIDNPSEIGDWYDFEVANINNHRKTYELIGTLFLGAGAVPNDRTLIVKDNIYAIEEVVPLVERTKEYQQLMITPPKTRTAPLRCMSCRDDKDLPCRNCGCYVCAGKEPPEDIILCDECDKGFHLTCLTPPLEEVPKEDWYCVSCVRQPLTPIAPGAAKQTKKVTKTNRDWGRGMACVGKTKTCAMPPHHYGPIPGIEVGMSWRFRIQLSETGIHRPPVSGIHGRDKDGAYSIVLSGGYEDDVDNGNEFTYTGSGGRDLSGNKRTAGQSCDQTLTRENRALARNCNVKCVSENGGDAGEDWRKGKPVRVVRSCKMLKHFPEYAPMEGLRYDGIYKVVKYYPEKGLSGFRVWKYLLRRDDPSPAPWEPSAKKYPIIYPDGYLEAEAEKKALKEKNIIKGNGSIVKGKGKIEGSLLSKTFKGSVSNTEGKGQKRMLADTIVTSSEIESSPPLKKQKTSEKGSGLSNEERVAIEADTVNMNLWSECVTVCEERGKKEFIEYMTQMFLCIICHNVVMSPVTTPCSHNFCMVCLNQVIKKSGPQCPCCRKNLAKYEVTPNEELKTALRTIMPGYDATN